MHINLHVRSDSFLPIIKLREALKTMKKFKYIGTLVNDCNALNNELIERKSKVLIVFSIHKTVLIDRNINLKTRF